MKKSFSPIITTILASSILLLSGCATPTGNTNGTTPVSTGISLGKAIFQSAVNTKCRTTLTNNQYWKAVSPALPQAKKDEIQTSVCGCVSAKAVQNVTPAELATAVINENARNQLVVTSVTNSFNSCYGEIAKSLSFGQ